MRISCVIWSEDGQGEALRLHSDMSSDHHKTLFELHRLGRGALTPTPSTSRLTPRQWDVLQLLCEGNSNKQIASHLHLGLGTVKVHLQAIYQLLGVQSRLQALSTVRAFDVAGFGLLGVRRA